MAKDGAVTLTGLGVMVVALSRFLALASPELVSFLKLTLSSAETAGLNSEDLELLKAVIRSISVASAEKLP